MNQQPKIIAHPANALLQNTMINDLMQLFFTAVSSDGIDTIQIRLLHFLQPEPSPNMSNAASTCYSTKCRMQIGVLQVMGVVAYI